MSENKVQLTKASVADMPTDAFSFILVLVFCMK